RRLARGRLRRARGLPPGIRAPTAADAQGVAGHRRTLEALSLGRRLVSLARGERAPENPHTGEDSEIVRRLDMSGFVRRILLGSFIAAASVGEAAAQAQPEGQLTVAFDASIAPTFLDPAETPGIGTPFVFLYALHDALVKPMPGNDMAPSLATSWKESADGLTYEFRLREGLKFHNGDPFTAEDVKFSFHRYRGTAAKLLHERVKAVEILDPTRVRFVLHAPWPDFPTFYATPATGPAWNG